MILGVEFYFGVMENGEFWYIFVVGLFEDFVLFYLFSFYLVEGQEIGFELVKWVWDVGVYVVIVYFEWGGMIFVDVDSIKYVYVVEIYNYICGVECDCVYGYYMLDQLLMVGWWLDFCVIDDVYFSEFDSFGGWVMVKVEENIF